MRQDVGDEAAGGAAVGAVSVPAVRRDVMVLSFDDFYRRELPGLIVLARALCGTGIAEDVAQETMLAAYRRWPHVRDLNNPEAWVRRVCVNLAVSQLRRRTIEARVKLRLAGRRTSLADVDQVHEEFWDQLRQLPRRQAQAAALRYVYELSVADIAETLECSEGTVKVHLTRARQALSQRLDMSTDGEA